MDPASSCLFCGHWLPRTSAKRKRREKTRREEELLQNWKISLSRSLCNVLQLEGDDFEIIFTNASFCLHCQQLVCDAEFAVNALQRLERQLNVIRKNIKALIFRKYTSMQPFSQNDPEQEELRLLEAVSIESMVRRISMKVEPGTEPGSVSVDFDVINNDSLLQEFDSYTSWCNADIPFNDSTTLIEDRMDDQECSSSDSMGVEENRLEDVDWVPDEWEENLTIENEYKRTCAIREPGPNRNKEKSQKKKRRKSYSCSHCEIEFTSYRNFSSHQRKCPERTQDGKLTPPIEGAAVTVPNHEAEEKDGILTKSSQNLRVGKGKSVVVCPWCQKVFGNKKTMEKHMNREYDSNVILPCIICWKEFITNEDRARHQDLHKEETPFACVICEENQANQNHLIQHVQKVHDLKRYYCNFTECKDKRIGFPFYPSMKKHLSEHHLLIGPAVDFIYHCMDCDSRFDRLESLRHHESSEHEPKEAPCPTCGKIFPSIKYLYVHRRHVHTEIQMKPRCKICTKRCDSSSAVEEHERLHSMEAPFGCVICGDSLLSTHALQKHVKRVHEILPFRCPEDGCQKSYDKKDKLSLHIRQTHPADKLYQCPHCPYKGLVPSNLKWHLLIHTKVKAYHCTVPECGRSYGYRSQLNRHLRTFHKIGKQESWDCKICGKNFRTKFGLGSHESYHANVRPFMCEICSATFKSKRNLHTHIKVHSKQSGTNVKLQRPRKPRLIGAHFLAVEANP